VGRGDVPGDGGERLGERLPAFPVTAKPRDAVLGQPVRRVPQAVGYRAVETPDDGCGAVVQQFVDAERRDGR
jgi:hypothetical protein